MITFTDAGRRAAMHHNGTMKILAHKTSSIGWTVALPAPTRIVHVDAGTLEFQPAGAHQVAALANLGHQLLQEIDAYRPGFLWTASPAEIVGALIEEMAPPTIEAKPQLATGEREAFDAWFGDTSKRGYVHNEVSAFSGWLAGRRAALAAAPVPALDTACRALESYADSYDRMGRISNGGKVDCTSVALDIRRNMVDAVRAAAPAQTQHPDDIAVDQYAAVMKGKLAASRAKGRGGWDDPTLCTIGDLAHMLCQHMLKGDPVDIGNFAMMLHQRDPEGEDAYQAISDASLTYLLIAPYPAAHGDAKDAERYRWLTEDQGLRYSPPGGNAITDLAEMNAAIDASISAKNASTS